MKRFFNFRNVVSPLLTAALVLMFSGCIKQKIVVKVKPDGSGTIIISAMYQKAIVEMIDKQMAMQKAQFEKSGMDSAAMDKAMKDPLFNEEQFEKQASMFGTDIEYIKAKKITNASGRGFMAAYAFKNIEDVNLDIDKLITPGPKFGNQEPSEDSITFKFKKGDVSVLTVNIPKRETAAAEDAKDAPKGPTPLTEQEKAQMGGQGAMFGLTGEEQTKEEVIRKMYGDMSMNISLQVVGTLVKSNATYKDPKKKGCCTLFALDFGTMLEDDVACTKMANNKSGNFMEAITASGTAKGMKFESKPKLTLEFKK